MRPSSDEWDILVKQLAIRSFKVECEPNGPGKGHWFWVRFYSNADKLQEAARRCDISRGFLSEEYTMLGCVQPTIIRERYSKEFKDWRRVSHRNKLCGVIRLIDPDGYSLNREHLAHELLHATLEIYRRAIRKNANFWETCNQSEEELCYIYGEMYNHFMIQYWSEPKYSQK